VTRFLANEKFPGASVRLLRAKGLDIAWVREEAPSSDDRANMAWAARTNRIILTFDLDYGDLVFRHGLAAPGVVLFRLEPLADLEEPGRVVLDLIERPDFTFEEAFVVVSRRGIRVVPMPPPRRQGGTS
jgi:predicted nuclease of predicted toxin-antitoxin system